MLTVFPEQVSHGEVVELESDTPDDTRLAPTKREFDLVIRLLHQIPVDVNRSVFVVRLHVGSYLLGVEVSHRGQFASRTHQGFLVEEVARLRTQLTAHYILVETVVTIDAHTADVSLLSFEDTHLQVDGVAHDVHFRRLQVIEKITVVPIVVAHGIIVFRQSLVHQLLVIHIAFDHAQLPRKQLGTVNRVTHPCDVTDEVFLSLIHLNIYINVLGVVGPH